MKVSKTSEEEAGKFLRNQGIHKNDPGLFANAAYELAVLLERTWQDGVTCEQRMNMMKNALAP